MFQGCLGVQPVLGVIGQQSAQQYIWIKQMHVLEVIGQQSAQQYIWIKQMHVLEVIGQQSGQQSTSIKQMHVLEVIGQQSGQQSTSIKQMHVLEVIGQQSAQQSTPIKQISQVKMEQVKKPEEKAKKEEEGESHTYTTDYPKFPDTANKFKLQLLPKPMSISTNPNRQVSYTLTKTVKCYLRLIHTNLYTN